MDEPKPFIKKFKTRRNYYVYDVNTSLIVKLDEVSYELVDMFPFPSKQEVIDRFSSRYTLEQLERAISGIETLAERLGVFKPIKVRSRMKSAEFVGENLHKMVGRFEQLVLSVSEQCNLRCSYCAYSGGYKNIRVHNDFTMSWDVARKAIDYFLANIGTQTGHPEIGFFGGEPLMNFGLIRQCIEYTRHKNADVSFAMTTNGTLLIDQVVGFLADKGVRILISLDGPKEIHDVDRIFAAGAGSFDLIMRNIRRIKEKYPDYYSKKVRYWCTITPRANYKKIFDFFIDNQDLFTPQQVGFGSVMSGHEEYLRSASGSGDTTATYIEMYRLFREKLIRGEIDDRAFRFLESLFEKPYLEVHKRKINLEGWGEDFHFMTACFPGFYRLFVKADGTFQICEKSNDALVIGHVNGGLDFEKIIDIYRKYRDLHNNECRSCWVYRFCKTCYVSSTCKTGKFEPALDPQFCNEQRKYWQDLLADYCAILEDNPQAFDYMDEIERVGAIIPVLQTQVE